MAEESLNSPLSPNIIKLDGDSSRRNSTGKAISSNSGEKVLPHYLRASTGSCHDFCKYGRKHAFESKPRHPMPKTIVTKPPDGQNPVDNVVVLERKKTMVVKLKPMPDSKTHTPDAGKIIKQERSAKSPNDQNKVLEKKKKTVVRIKPSPNSKIHSSDSPQIGNPEVPPSSKRASLKVEMKNLSAKPAASLKAESVRVLSGRRNSDGNTLKRTEASKVAVRKAFTPSASSFSLKPYISRTGSLNTRKLKSMKVVSRKAELKQPNNGEVQEKTLYVVKMDTEYKPPESDENVDQPVGTYPVPSSSSPKSVSHEEEEDQEESEYTECVAEDNSILENDEIVNLENAVTLEAEKDRTRRKYMDGQLVKLNFRRGRVVDIQSENNGPRRLRFRRGRVLGESKNVKADARGRSIKAREVVDSVKVVLKHQDVQVKKKSRVLFNNVIEETASKLVETRKSKVKALVGAFETVISLQESKPSSNTVS